MGDIWWKDRRVFVTGHTGFMGGWLCSYLLSEGAIVTGYALEPITNPSFFETASLDDHMSLSVIGDVRDFNALSNAISTADPEVIFHLAAQPLVLTAHENPVDTFETNVMGTVNVMQAARELKNLSAMLLVTTDKVYQNKNWHWPYRESDPLGGKEPYSASKAASEHVISAYAKSYFSDIGVAALRVGNIIGGGDWAANRLVPDAIRQFSEGSSLSIRNPQSTRPWQHVLDPLPGYLKLARALSQNGKKFSGGWNFGPAQADCQSVDLVADQLANAWGDGARVEVKQTSTVFEETLLSLDSSKAHALLDWAPKWDLSLAVDALVKWHKAQINNEDMWTITQSQITEFKEKKLPNG